nr:helix-turn-helix transcriptional regulator [uncultured Carboxylicivirga sp.]
MKNKVKINCVDNYTSFHGDKILAEVGKQIKGVYLNEHAYSGILNLNTHLFTLYKCSLNNELAFSQNIDFWKQPSLPFLLQLMPNQHKKLLIKSMNEIDSFFQKNHSVNRSHYRFSFDTNVSITNKGTWRVLVHMQYLQKVPDISYDSCLFTMLTMRKIAKPTPFLRSFYKHPSYKLALFKRGEGRSPCFTQNKINVIKLLALGYSQKEIAARLKCSESNINNTLANTRKKLHLFNNSHLVHYAHCYGLL